MRPLLVLALLVLAACGADGAPLRPQGPERPAPEGAGEAGVVTSGSFSLGLSL